MTVSTSFCGFGTAFERFLATVRFTGQIPIMSGSAELWSYYEYINGRKRF